MSDRKGGDPSKELVEKQLQDMIDSYPEVEELKDFDTFLVGDGSAQLMSKIDKPASGGFNFQLSGIYSFTDLVDKRDPELYNDSLTNDLGEYCLELSIDEQYFDHYVRVKSRILTKYNFLEIKSRKLVGRPFKEIDLVVSDNERYQVKYLVSKGGIDYGIINSLAQLRALMDLGFSECKFRGRDGCPLCSAFDGNIYSVFGLCDIFGSGKYIIHGNCIGDFIPVIRDRSIVRDFEIDCEEVFIGETKVKNLPLEFAEDLAELLPNCGLEEVHFVNLNDEFKNVTSEVVVDYGGVLYVHNTYYGSYSPFDFLKNWLESLDIQELSNLEVEKKIVERDFYYLDGRKVVEVNGVYFDVETKEQVR